MVFLLSILVKFILVSPVYAPVFSPAEAATGNPKVISELDLLQNQGITLEQLQWRRQLEICESNGNTLAVNPQDTDGTASYSLFQWKPSTWQKYVRKYNLFNWQEWDEMDWWNTMHSDYHQRVIINYMFYDEKVIWENEFPQCIKEIIGYPPLKLN